MEIILPDKKAIIKQDANFLEYPLWRTDRRDNRAQFIVETKDGRGRYLYTAKEGMVPDNVDMSYLYYFILMHQKTGNRKNQYNTHQVLKRLKHNTGVRGYTRLETSLERWNNVSVRFEGNFFIKEKEKNGKETVITKRINKGFHILEYDYTQTYSSEKKYRSHTFDVELNEKFLNAIEDSGFIKYIDLNKFIALKTPTAQRLYEWLPKQLINRKKFIIRDDTFFDKMRILPVQYPSEKERKLKTILTALKQINKIDETWNYSLQWELKEDEKGKYFLLTFSKKRKNKPKPPKNQLPFESSTKKKDDIAIALEAIEFDKIQEVRANYSDDILQLIMDDLTFHMHNAECKEIKNPASWFYSRLPELNKPYILTSAYQKHLNKQKKKIEQKKDNLGKVEIEKLEDLFKEDKKQRLEKFMQELTGTKEAQIKKDFDEHMKTKSSFERSRYQTKGIQGVQTSYNSFIRQRFFKPVDNDFILWAEKYHNRKIQKNDQNEFEFV